MTPSIGKDRVLLLYPPHSLRSEGGMGGREEGGVKDLPS